MSDEVGGEMDAIAWMWNALVMEQSLLTVWRSSSILSKVSSRTGSRVFMVSAEETSREKVSKALMMSRM